MDREIISLMFYQHCHDKNYHHDIYVLSRQRKLNHLIHHLHKYNNSSIKPANWLEDTLACVLSMATAMNMHLDHELSRKLLVPIKEVKDIVPFYNAELVPTIFTDKMRLLSKTMESLDHVEDFDFNGTLRECIVDIVILVFQLHDMETQGNNEHLVQMYMLRLDVIKTRHCFHEYFDLELRKAHSSYVDLRIKYLHEPTVSHYIHASQSVRITKVG